MSGKIFNVEESSHPSEFQTTAAQAQAHAPTASIAREVEANAERAKEVAENAAFNAQHKGPALTGQTATDRLTTDASVKTGAAVDQGKENVAAARDAAGGYVEQAKTMVSNMASSAAATAQSYIPPGSGPDGAHTAGDVVAGLQTGVTTAAVTTKNIIVSASETAKPYIASAAETAKPYIASAQETVKPYIASAQETAASYLPGSATTQTAPVEAKNTTVKAV